VHNDYNNAYSGNNHTRFLLVETNHKHKQKPQKIHYTKSRSLSLVIRRAVGSTTVCLTTPPPSTPPLVQQDYHAHLHQPLMHRHVRVVILRDLFEE
jgi:hypothetical protein